MTTRDTSPHAPIELVIFDCDGVLVDSEHITNRVFAQMMAELGVTLSPAYMEEHFFGRAASECVRLAQELLGVRLPGDFTERYGQRSRAALADEVTLMPGVAALLDALTWPCAIASNGLAAKMRVTLGKTGLLERFEGRWFSIEDVVNGKPAPDIYLHAARTLGARPAACVVVEDSPTGVSAGVAAGMTVFGFAAQTPTAVLIDAGAQLAFTELNQLPALLRLVAPAVGHTLRTPT